MGLVVSSKCYIFGGFAEEIDIALAKEIKTEDYVVCADNGLSFANEFGISPNLVVGDFDSFKEEVNTSADVIKLPKEKDDTDLFFAVNEALSRGYKDIILSGVTGGRLDMSFATVSTLIFAHSKGAKIRVYDKSHKLFIISSSLTLKKPKNSRYFSVFPLTDEVKGLKITGAKYSAQNMNLVKDFPIGVSNEFAQNEVKISLEDGLLLVITVA